MQPSKASPDAVRRKASRCFAVLFVVILFAVPALTFLLPRLSVSDIENRRLAAAPVLTRDALVSGDYFSGWETYLKDHIVFRDGMLMGRTWLDLNILNRASVNGILPTDTCLLPHLTPSDASVDELAQQAASMADRLASLKETVTSYGGTLLYVIVPTQMTAFESEFPLGLYSGAETRAASKALFESALDARSISYLDMKTIFDQAGGTQQFYMQTDHHYSLKGAFLVYQSIIKKVAESNGSYSIGKISSENVSFSAVSSVFHGSRSRAIYYLTDLQDDFFTCTLREPVAFSRFDNGQPVDSTVIRLPDDASAPVTYSAYMGGDIAETVIQTNRSELPDILIFGDSYTNAVETFLYASFNEMRSLDLRHYREMALLDYVRLHQPDIVVCLRDDANLLTETGNGAIR